MSLNRPLVIHLNEPDWDLMASDDLERILVPGFDSAEVVIDMTRVEYMDSTCLGKLARLHVERVKNRGFPPARFVIRSPNIRHLFQIVNFDRLWPIYQTLTEAVGAAIGSNHRPANPYRIFPEAG